MPDKTAFPDKEKTQTFLYKQSLRGFITRSCSWGSLWRVGFKTENARGRPVTQRQCCRPVQSDRVKSSHRFTTSRGGGWVSGRTECLDGGRVSVGKPRGVIRRELRYRLRLASVTPVRAPSSALKLCRRPVAGRKTQASHGKRTFARGTSHAGLGS